MWWSHAKQLNLKLFCSTTPRVTCEGDEETTAVRRQGRRKGHRWPFPVHLPMRHQRNSNNSDGFRLQVTPGRMTAAFSELLGVQPPKWEVKRDREGSTRYYLEQWQQDNLVITAELQTSTMEQSLLSSTNRPYCSTSVVLSSLTRCLIHGNEVVIIISLFSSSFFLFDI